MNVHVPSPSEIAARRARLMGCGTVVNIAPRSKLAENPQERPDTPADAHVRAYEDYLSRLAKCPSAAAYVRLRCKVLDLPYDRIMSRCHKYDVVAARSRMMWEVKERYPYMSLARIGRLFGRDHTTVIHALKKFGYQPGDQIQGIAAETVAAMRELRRRGLSQRETADRLGISQGTVSRYERLARARR